MLSVRSIIAAICSIWQCGSSEVSAICCRKRDNQTSSHVVVGSTGKNKGRGVFKLFALRPRTAVFTRCKVLSAAVARAINLSLKVTSNWLFSASKAEMDVLYFLSTRTAGVARGTVGGSFLMGESF